MPLRAPNMWVHLIQQTLKFYYFALWSLDCTCCWVLLSCLLSSPHNALRLWTAMQVALCIKHTTPGHKYHHCYIHDHHSRRLIIWELQKRTHAHVLTYTADIVVFLIFVFSERSHAVTFTQDRTSQQSKISSRPIRFTATNFKSLWGRSRQQQLHFGAKLINFNWQDQRLREKRSNSKRCGGQLKCIYGLSLSGKS